MDSKEFNKLLSGYISDGSGIYQQNVTDKESIDVYTDEMIQGYIVKACRREAGNYPGTDKWLHEMLDKYVHEQGRWMVVGSGNPWYEAVAMSRFAESVEVMEQRKITYKGKYPIYYQKGVLGSMDYILNISTVEHAGLGRYGDELDPDGDLKLMMSLRDSMSKDSIMFLAVPMNPEGGDLIMWPAHRVYGKNRIKRLLQGYRVIDFTWDNRYQSQPLYALVKA